MTPFKSNRGGGGGLFSGGDTVDHQPPASNGVCLFGGTSTTTTDHDGDEEMDSMTSPPRVHNKTGGTLPTADLFGNNNNNEATASNKNGTARRRRMRTRMSSGSSPDGSFIGSDAGSGGILRNMDMNASSPSSSSAGRKRPSDSYPAGREEYMEESDDDDMFVSPRVSPSYRKYEK